MNDLKAVAKNKKRKNKERQINESVLKGRNKEGKEIEVTRERKET